MLFRCSNILTPTSWPFHIALRQVLAVRGKAYRRIDVCALVNVRNLIWGSHDSSGSYSSARNALALYRRELVDTAVATIAAVALRMMDSRI